MQAQTRKTIVALSLMVTMSSVFLPMPAQAQAPASVEQPTIESAFSPEAGGERLVLKVIGTAQQELRLAAYSFTSMKIAQALVAAHQRGVDVRLVADEKRNRGKPSQAALGLLARAGIAVKTVAVYALHHDKYMVVDGRHVQNGSFNYTAGAATANSENVLVVWNDPALAAAFLKHWQSRWDQGKLFAPA